MRDEKKTKSQLINELNTLRNQNMGDQSPGTGDDAYSDISDRKEREQKLRQNEEKFRTLFENAGVGIFRASVDLSKFLAVNNKLATIFETDINTLLNDTGMLQWKSTKVKNDMQDILEKEGSLFNYEMEATTLTGKSITLMISLQLFSEKGYVEGTAVEITMKKKVEKQRNKLMHDMGERIKELECIFALTELIRKRDDIDTLLQDAVEIIPTGWQFPKKTRARITYNNDFFTSEGFAESPWLQTTDLIIHEKKQGKIEVFLLEDNPERDDGPFLKEERNLLKIIAHNLGEAIEGKSAEQELERFNTELKRSNEELEQFAYVASHDLQEPLRMVSSYTQLLEKKYKNQLDEKANKYIYYAVDGASRMQLLISDLLTYSRITTRGMPFSRVDVNDILTRALTNLKTAIRENEAKITHNNLPTLDADSAQLQRVFQNLLSNAIKYRNKDAQPLIHIASEEQGKNWLFAVRDNGIGIDPKYKERLFIIFQRLHTSQEFPGTGIGLAIAKRIVERHGGNIWFESSPGKGSTFYFTLPKHQKV